MNKKYKITSKFRFTMFLTIMLLVIITVCGSLLGFNTASSTSYDQYSQVKVETGDTIWEIASRYAPNDKDVREVVYDICEANEITPTDLYAGQKIVVPVYN